MGLATVIATESGGPAVIAARVGVATALEPIATGRAVELAPAGLATVIATESGGPAVIAARVGVATALEPIATGRAVELAPAGLAAVIPATAVIPPEAAIRRTAPPSLLARAIAASGVIPSGRAAETRGRFPGRRREIIPFADAAGLRLLLLNGLEGDVPQGLDLLGRQVTPLTGLELAELEPVEGDTFEGDDVQPHLRAHLADLAVPSLAKNETEKGPAVVELLQKRNAHGTEKVAVDRHRRLESREGLVAEKAGDLDMVDLLVVVAGMGDMGDEVTIVRQEEKTAAIAVETSDRDEAGGDRRDELRHASTAVAIARRAEISGRLVQHDRAFFSGRLGERLVVHEDLLPVGIDLYAHLTYDISIDTDAALPDEFLRMAAGSDARAGKGDLEADHAIVGLFDVFSHFSKRLSSEWDWQRGITCAGKRDARGPRPGIVCASRSGSPGRKSARSSRKIDGKRIRLKRLFIKEKMKSPHSGNESPALSAPADARAPGPGPIQNGPFLAIFDLDGTLLDTRADLAAALNRTRRRLGLAPIPRETVVRAVGNGVRRLIERTIPEEECPLPLEEKVAIQGEEYGKGLVDETVPYPGVEETLRSLRAAGWRLAVLSNKPDEATRRLMVHFGWDRLLDVIQGGAPTVPLKPDPAAIDHVLRAAGHDGPRQAVWMVGDNYTDLEAGRRAGVKRCFCRYGFGSPRGETADFIADDLPAWGRHVLPLCRP